YDVRILLAETRYRERGARVFTVRVNAAPVFTAVDLADRYGPNAAVERTVRVRASGGSGVRVELESASGATTISGIELRRR
ncbi:MAG: malectin domain-containing carbohydrate-binding protein, partial [Gemmatimonadota bacterium]